MGNATRFYCTRESVKLAADLAGAKINALLDQYIEAASVDIEIATARRFIPYTATKLYPWPQNAGASSVLYLDEDLISVTALKAAAQDASPTTIVAADYFLEPVNEPPYRRIEIDLSSDAAFAAGDTGQRSISVAGSWGYSADTIAAGALAAALVDTTGTVVDVTNSKLVGVGDTLLIDSEQMFVSEKGLLTTGTTLNDASVTANQNDVTITVASGAAILQGEVITLDSERMLVESISGNDLTVQRGYDGSVLAAHTTGITVYAPRRLTVVRGVNGTTAATHLIAAAAVRFAPPADVVKIGRAHV